MGHVVDATDTDAGAAFLQRYYGLFDRDRAALAPFFHDRATLTFDGARVQGATEIVRPVRTPRPSLVGAWKDALSVFAE